MALFLVLHYHTYRTPHSKYVKMNLFLVILMCTLWTLIKHPIEQGVKVKEDEIKVVLLKNLLSKYSNIIFTLSDIPSHPLKTMISTPLKR
jgi:hypothetical protein